MLLDGVLRKRPSKENWQQPRQDELLQMTRVFHGRSVEFCMIFKCTSMDLFGMERRLVTTHLERLFVS